MDPNPNLRAARIQAAQGAVAAGIVYGDITIHHTGRPGSRRPMPVPKHLASRPARVIGRDELLNDMGTRLCAGSGVSVLALCGLGGVGKTTLAVEFAHRHFEDYELVWHLHAETETELQAQFHGLAMALGIDTAGDPVDLVHHHLGKLTAGWLLVLDNVPDHESVRRWLPSWGRGHVLVTTQDGRWPLTQAMDVTTLSLDSAVALLRDTSGVDEPDTAAEIVIGLDLLPLAVVQAAAYVHESGRSLSEYLALMRRARTRLMAQAAPGDHPDPVTVTWTMAIDALARTDPSAVTLLRLLAFTAPDRIPYRLLLEAVADLPEGLDPAIANQIEALVGDPIAADTAIRGLRRYSLITAPNPTISVHRLVQTVTSDSLPLEELDQWQAATAALIAAAVPADIGQREAWSVCAALVSHAMAACDLTSEPIWLLAESLGRAGDYATASIVFSTIVDAYGTRFGADHLDTLWARHRLAYWTGHAGDFVGARDMFADLLAALQKVSVPDDLIISARLFHARWTGDAGNPSRARDMFADLLATLEKAPDLKDMWGLSVSASLARWIGEAGDPAAARDILATVLSQREQRSDLDELNTFDTHCLLARWTGEAGDPAAARDILRAVLARWEPILGPEHPMILHVHANEARWIGEAGDAVSARDMFAALLPLRQKVSGPTHPHTLDVRANLARWARQAAEQVARTSTPDPGID